MTAKRRHFTWGRSALAAVFVCMACEKPNPTPPPRPSEHTASVSPPPTPLAVAKEPTVPEPEPLIEGCAADAGTGEDASRGLNALREACVSSMTELLPKAFLVHLAHGEKKELPFTIIEHERCLRILAAADERVVDFALTLVDRSGSELGQDELRGPFALLAKEGPICLSEPGQYRAIVELTRGQGEIALQIFQAE